MEIFFASQNENKIKEIGMMMPSFVVLKGLKDLGHTDEIPETSLTIAGNSYQKAIHIYKKYKVSAFADDTGLEIDSLNYEPGVYSARYAGPEKSSEKNIDLVLKKMKGVSDRKARFVTVITYVKEDGQIEYFKGEIEGTIETERKGKGGFGYDPIFTPVGFDKTFAEMSLEAKNKISHRGLAFRSFIEYLKTLDE